jgi:cell division protein FtsW (lipid II flippase)
VQKALHLFFNIIPILVMIGLIPLVQDDYVLTLLYVGIIIIALFIKRERNEVLVLCTGAIFMTASEYLFISTGVETFIRNSLFGLMPLWLPVLWGYGFVVIKRAAAILDN